MTPDANNEFPPISPEYRARIYEHYRKLFTPEKLIEYIENDDEKFTYEEVMATAEAIDEADAAKDIRE
jgi:hypothetical protein